MGAILNIKKKTGVPFLIFYKGQFRDKFLDLCHFRKYTVNKKKNTKYRINRKSSEKIKTDRLYLLPEPLKPLELKNCSRSLWFTERVLSSLFLCFFPCFSVFSQFFFQLILFLSLCSDLGVLG